MLLAFQRLSLERIRQSRCLFQLRHHNSLVLLQEMDKPTHGIPIKGNLWKRVTFIGNASAEIVAIYGSFE